jgi:cation transport regulator ChaB
MAEDEDTRPTPDPTTLTTAQLIRQVQAERDYVDAQLDVIRERLRGIDVATKLLNETVNRVPTDVQIAVEHLKELHAERFASVDKQFAERDTRAERESRDNKVAVDAAFAAQKEAAAKQDEGNQKAIDKSERTTNETILKNEQLAKTETKATNDKVEDIKDRVSKMEIRLNGFEALKHGGEQQRDTTRQGYFLAIGALGLIVTILVAAFAIYAATHHG